MSYNETFFRPEDNARYLSKLNLQLVMQKRVLDFLIKNLIAANNQIQLEHCDCFLHLIAKIRINLESINSVLTFLYEDYRFKVSANLLYRSVVDDIITITYLIGFIKLDDPLQSALNNELNILHKEYLLSSIEAVKSEFEFQDLVNSYKNEPSIEKPDYIKEIKESNPELIDENFEWKRNEDIRKTTHLAFIDLMNQDGKKRKSFITEEKKLEFIKNRGFETHSQLRGLFKYYTQYQHYSPKTINLLNSHIDFDIVSYQNVLGNVVLTIDRLYDFINFENKESLKKEWEELSNIVFDSFKE
ncbi:MAG: hypothetical protein JST50_15805 [Bacteroidetes bacterium]|jgi:hypothetical protein|nr:hypothetical protein [Bacteroidota bacterium]